MIKIVTDSGATLPPSIVREFDIGVVPLSVSFGNTVYRDGVDLTTEEFYARLRSSDVFPQTSQPSPQDFIAAYEPLLTAGHEIISIHLSSKLSGTYNSAVQASKMLEGAPITVIDTLAVSVAEALLIVAAQRFAEGGVGREEIAARITAFRETMALLFVLDTLEFLKRGGRIGGARAFIGTMLQIKPILQIVDGVVEPFDRVRTRRRALNRLVEALVDRFGDRPVWLGVVHAEASDDAQMVYDACARQLNVEYYVESVLGPSVGAHAGPGAVGAAVMPAPKLG